ncbi:M24 family metallopeptidase [Guggenheimella bovis]
MQRIGKLRTVMQEKGLDAVMFYKPENRYYVSGFEGTTGYALITKDDTFFITDFRYVTQASEQTNFKVEIIGYDRNVYDVINEKVQGKLGFEDDFMSVEEFNHFSEKLQSTLVPMKRLIEDIRIIKDEKEIETLSEAAKIGDRVFNYLLTVIKPGMTEKQVYHMMLNKMRELGAENESFTAIVASGVRGAMPHGLASDKVIEEGDLLTLDFGVIYNKYCSDMTRTICVGKASDKQKELYSIVLEAQLRALEAIKPGVTGEAVDKVARDYIAEKGYGDHFGHGLGHGVGVEIHEAPRLAPKATQVLEPGMIVTDEPGIYIENFGGVRIEDLILVTEDGYRLLSHSPKELIELNV